MSAGRIRPAPGVPEPADPRAARDSPAFLPFAAAAKLPPAQAEARQRRLSSGVFGALAAALALLAGGGAATFAARAEAAKEWAVVFGGFWVAAVAALVARCMSAWFRRARAPAGWVLRGDAARLLVNLRSHMNAHLDPASPVILVLPRALVRSLRIIRERGVRVHLDDYGEPVENPIRRVFLEIVHDGDPEAIRAELAAEARRYGPATLGSSRTHHTAVTMPPGGALRISWSDEANRLAPAPEEFLRRLGPGWPVDPPAERAELPFADLDRRGRETRLLEMAARGDRAGAATLAARLYGMELAEALRFVDGLTGRGGGEDPDASRSRAD